MEQHMPRFRRIREQDFLEIMRLAESCDPIPLERDSIYHLFTRDFGDTCFVAVDKGRIVAFLLGIISQTNRRIGYVHNICVDPNWRRRGIGRRLYQRFMSKIADQGCRRVFLIVNPANRVSIEFHKRLGFEECLDDELVELGGVKAIRDYNGPGKHMVVLWKTTCS